MTATASHADLARTIDHAWESRDGIGLSTKGAVRDAVEVDVDALCDGDDVVVAGVLQHIEEAGVHSGDSACSLPPYSLSADIIAEI